MDATYNYELAFDTIHLTRIPPDNNPIVQFSVDDDGNFVVFRRANGNMSVRDLRSGKYVLDYTSVTVMPFVTVKWVPVKTCSLMFTEEHPGDRGGITMYDLQAVRDAIASQRQLVQDEVKLTASRLPHVHEDYMSDAAIDPTGYLLLTCSVSNEVKLWVAASGTLLACEQVPNGCCPLEITWAPVGDRFLLKCNDHTCFVVSIHEHCDNGSVLFEWQQFSEQVESACWSRSGKHLYVGSVDNIYLKRTNNLTNKVVCSIPRGKITSISCRSTGELLVAIGNRLFMMDHRLLKSISFNIDSAKRVQWFPPSIIKWGFFCLSSDGSLSTYMLEKQ